MSEERLCEAYGEHQAYCSLYGYPLGKDVAELIAAARAAAVAPLEKALRAVWLTSPVNCIPESLLIEIERLLASAPSPVREPEGLDVERLGLSDEQTAILREHLSSRQQTLSAFLGDVLMELGLGRATGKEYPPPTWVHNDWNDPSGLYDDNWEPRPADEVDR